MVCNACGSTGPFAVVGSEVTLLGNIPWTDGRSSRVHHHDTNITTTGYLCSCGRRFAVSRKLGRCWCGWRATEDA